MKTRVGFIIAALALSAPLLYAVVAGHAWRAAAAAKSRATPTMVPSTTAGSAPFPAGYAAQNFSPFDNTAADCRWGRACEHGNVPVFHTVSPATLGRLSGSLQIATATDGSEYLLVISSYDTAVDASAAVGDLGTATTAASSANVQDKATVTADPAIVSGASASAGYDLHDVNRSWSILAASNGTTEVESVAVWPLTHPITSPMTQLQALAAWGLANP